MITQAVLSRYTYDPLDRLAGCFARAETPVRRFYLDRQLITEVRGSEHRSIFRAGDQLLAQKGLADNALLGTDPHNSVLSAASSNLAYTPYGHRELVVALPGFNGEQPEPVTGHYLLGAGYRAFSPVLMRFNSPDDLSPFGEGGFNAYAYCLGDPVNRVDPTGHLTWRSGLQAGSGLFGVLLGMVTFSQGGPLAAAALVTGVAASAVGIAQIVTEDTDQQLSQRLDEIGLVLGTASLGLGGLAALKGGPGPRPAPRGPKEPAIRLSTPGSLTASRSAPSASPGGASPAQERSSLRLDEFDMRNLTVGNQRVFRTASPSSLQVRLPAVEHVAGVSGHGVMRSQRAVPDPSRLVGRLAGYSAKIPRVQAIRSFRQD